jgi:hypothetical protein
MGDRFVPPHALVLGRTIALAVASLIAIAGPLAALQAQESPPTPDCRARQPDQCVKTCGCVFYEHAAELPCRSVHDRSRVKLFDPRSTTVIRGKCPPPKG